jgi:hypothetical protein
MVAIAELVNLALLIDDAKCFAMVRQHRWPGTTSRCGFGCCASTSWG